MTRRNLNLLVSAIFILVSFFFTSSTNTQKPLTTSMPPVLSATDSRALVRVTKVIDGDTIQIETGEKVRYIGIDTPESTIKHECFGKEASIKNKELVLGKEVRLEKDVSETDKYGRLLRYVYLDNVMINDELVKEGFANVSTYPPDVKYQNLFRESEKYARENNLGLWGKCF